MALLLKLPKAKFNRIIYLASYVYNLVSYYI